MENLIRGSKRLFHGVLPVNRYNRRSICQDSTPMSPTPQALTAVDQSAERTPLRFVTAASLFDGHDAAINIMRRLIQAQGAEVIHLDHRCQLVMADMVVRGQEPEPAIFIAHPVKKFFQQWFVGQSHSPHGNGFSTARQNFLHLRRGEIGGHGNAPSSSRIR